MVGLGKAEGDLAVVVMRGKKGLSRGVEKEEGRKLKREIDWETATSWRCRGEVRMKEKCERQRRWTRQSKELVVETKQWRPQVEFRLAFCHDATAFGPSAQLKAHRVCHQIRSSIRSPYIWKSLMIVCFHAS